MTIKDLYDRIPKMHCHPDCHACCVHNALIIWSEHEFARASKHLDLTGKYILKSPNGPVVTVVSGPDKEAGEEPCVFLGEGGCTIYPHRPFICRLFGTTEAPLNCFAGIEPERRLSREEADRLMRYYSKRFCKMEGMMGMPSKEKT